MLDSVLHEFDEDDGQRRGHLSRELTGVTLETDVDLAVGQGQAVGDHPDDRPAHLSELDSLPGVARQRLVHQGDGRDTALGLLESGPRLGAAQPACLQAEQAGNRLQVVLDPVVDLLDDGLLAGEHPLPVAKLGDVAHEQHAPDDIPVRAAEERHGALQHDGAADLDLRLQWRAHVQGGPGQRRFDADVGEALAHDVGHHAEAAVGGDGVGARVEHPALRVEAQESVAHPGRQLRIEGLSLEGEIAFLDHAGQRQGARQVGLLELSRPAVAKRDALHGHHGDHPALVRHGHRFHTHLQAVDQHGFVSSPAPGLGEGPVDDRQLLGPHDPREGILGMQRLCGNGPQLAQADESLGLGQPAPQEQVGEGKVGNELPGSQEVVQMCDLWRIQIGPFPRALGHRRHPAHILWARFGEARDVLHAGNRQRAPRRGA